MVEAIDLIEQQQQFDSDGVLGTKKIMTGPSVLL